MSVRFLNEGFDVSYFNLLKESTIKRIKEILLNLNEAEMSAEDKLDTRILRDIMRKAQDAQYDKRRSLNYTPRELEVAQKYNLDLPTKVKKWDGTQITDLRDRDVDTPRGEGRNRYTPSLSRDIGQERGLRYNRGANLANYIRTRKEKGPKSERPYREFDKYARNDDTNTFGDTTFTHDKTGRFGRDSWDTEHGRAPSLAGGKMRAADLTDVEKDRVRVNKEMSQPMKDMKAALKDRKENQADLNNVNLNYARNVADARRRFDDAMAYADEQKRKESERGRQGLDDANSRINKLLKKESLDESVREKGEVKLGDGIHIYRMFGFPEYRDAEGVVKFIDGDEIYGSWGDDPLTFSDDWEIIDDSRMFESFRKALKEKIMSLNEAEMSDEDRHDSDILKQIYQKTQGRANAALTQEEKDVLKKYNLERVPYTKNIRPSEGPYRNPIFDEREFNRPYDWRTGKTAPAKSDMINYADRARKRPERNAQMYDMRDRDYWDMPTPDYERQHEVDSDDYKPATYQQRQRYSDNQKMTQNVRDMTRALKDRKASQAKLDSAESDYRAELDRLKKEYEDRLAAVKLSQQYRTDSDRRHVDYANKRINKLLGKEEE